MSGRRALAAAIVATAVAGGVLLARPHRYEVEGLSMAPGLMPGDVVATGWWPAADRLRRPRRFERWIVAPPAGEHAVKRVVGLPGEVVEIRGGDLVVKGAAVKKDPRALAAVAIPITTSLDVGRHHARLTAAEVLDDDAFSTEVNRVLEAVRDVGLRAALCSGTAAARATVVLGNATIRWRLPPKARLHLIAGRLDGHLVAVCWRDRQAVAAPPQRSGLPHALPAAWSYATPCEAASDATPLRAEIRVSESVEIAAVAAWRDIQLRPAPDGTAAWRLDGGSYLLLGDFPSGSIDSRTWGPLLTAALLHRVQPSD